PLGRGGSSVSPPFLGVGFAEGIAACILLRPLFSLSFADFFLSTLMVLRVFFVVLPENKLLLGFTLVVLAVAFSAAVSTSSAVGFKVRISLATSSLVRPLLAFSPITFLRELSIASSSAYTSLGLIWLLAKASAVASTRLSPER